MSIYVVCVMLRLFSALSRRVGAIQISIIIIITILSRKGGGGKVFLISEYAGVASEYYKALFIYCFEVLCIHFC